MNLAKGATRLTFTGVDFMHTAWGGPDSDCGYVPMQAGMVRTQPKSSTHHDAPQFSIKLRYLFEAKFCGFN